MLRHVDPAGNAIALSFDDGPDPRTTPMIVDALARHGVPATFCMIAREADAHPELVDRVLRGGNRVCDHTYDHDVRLNVAPLPAIDRELATSRDDLNRLAGPAGPVRLFRAPDGHWSPPLEAEAARAGMQPLGWSIDPRDWARPGTRSIVDTVERQVRPGSIVLMHDGGGPRTETVQALDQLLPWLQAHGYRFVLPSGPPATPPPPPGPGSPSPSPAGPPPSK